MGKGFRVVPLSFNRLAVIASASVTRETNAIHSLVEIDITEPRRRMKAIREKTGEKPSMTAFIVTTLAQTLRDHPQLNSFIKGNKLIVLEDLTISVLVERDLGDERVPEPLGIQAAQKKSFLQIHQEIRAAMQLKPEQGFLCNRKQGDRGAQPSELSRRGQQDASASASGGPVVPPKASLGSLSGATWIRFIPGFLLRGFIKLANTNISMAKRYGKVSVTALGMHGKNIGWFIPHGSATVLLTVGGIRSREMRMGDGFEPREFLCLTVSFDHNIVDGAPAARFMRQFTDLLERGEVLKEEE